VACLSVIVKPCQWGGSGPLGAVASWWNYNLPSISLQSEYMGIEQIKFREGALRFSSESFVFLSPVWNYKQLNLKTITLTAIYLRMWNIFSFLRGEYWQRVFRDRELRIIVAQKRQQTRRLNNTMQWWVLNLYSSSNQHMIRLTELRSVTSTEHVACMEKMKFYPVLFGRLWEDEKIWMTYFEVQMRVSYWNVC